MKKNNTFLMDFIIIATVMLLVWLAVLILTESFQMFKNPYNSYSLQAQRWLQGRLDLGQDYSHLEIAQYGGKYFVSFPPLPSVALLPFVIFFGADTPDSAISIIIAIIGAYYALKLCCHYGKSSKSAIFWILLLTCGSNFLFVMLKGWVWFMAQTMSFSLLLASIYYMIEKKPSLSLFLLAAAVGCRPFCIIYFPFLLYFMYKNGTSPSKLAISLVPSVLLGFFYMLLNFLRFDNPFEFGHNYLPEFLDAEYGQFSFHYIADNLKNLIRLPISNGKLVLPKFNGFAFYLVCPLYIVYAIRLFTCKKSPEDYFLLGLIVLHLLLFASHRTLGGWHFGNRYTVDPLPFVFYGAMKLPRHRKQNTLYALFLIFGFALNLYGTIWFFTSA